MRKSLFIVLCIIMSVFVLLGIAIWRANRISRIDTHFDAGVWVGNIIPECREFVEKAKPIGLSYEHGFLRLDVYAQNGFESCLKSMRESDMVYLENGILLLSKSDTLIFLKREDRFLLLACGPEYTEELRGFLNHLDEAEIWSGVLDKGFT